MTDTIAEALDDFDQRLAEAQKSAEALARTFRSLRQAAKVGDVGKIDKGLKALPELGVAAAGAAAGIPDGWRFDVSAYLASGYAAELVRAAAASGIDIVERDGRLYAFPAMLRIEPGAKTIRIGRKRAAGIRPSRVVEQVVALRKRPQSSQQFLGLLYKAYQRMAGRDWRSQPPVLSLAEIHLVLTLLPGTDYPLETFGRDLLLLDRQPDLRTGDGRAFEFVGSTLAKEKMQRISTYDEDGNERTFIGVRFREPA